MFALAERKPGGSRAVASCEGAPGSEPVHAGLFAHTRARADMHAGGLRLGARVVAAGELVDDVGGEWADDGHSVGDAAARAGRVDDEGALGGSCGDADEASRQGGGGDFFFAAASDRVGEAVDAGGEERLGGLGGDVAGREAGAAGRENETGAVPHGGDDRGADGIDLVGNNHDRGVNTMIGEEARGEGPGEVLGEACGAPVGDGDDARGDHVSGVRCRGDARSGARGCRR